MRSILIALIVIFLSFGSAFALADNTNQQGQLQGQGQDQDQLQLQGQAQQQGQLQGQDQGQLQGQGQVSVGKVKVNTEVINEDSDNAPDAIAFPAVAATEGVQSGTLSYLFGSLGKADTELYKKAATQIQVILAIPDEYIGQEEKAQLISDLINKMKKSNRTQRFLGFLWEDNSKSILNLNGLLTWGSVWAEGQNPFQSKRDME